MRAPSRTWVFPFILLALAISGCGRGEVKRLRLEQAALQDRIHSQDGRINMLEGEVANLQQQKARLDSEIEALRQRELERESELASSMRPDADEEQQPIAEPGVEAKVTDLPAPAPDTSNNPPATAVADDASAVSRPEGANVDHGAATLDRPDAGLPAEEAAFAIHLASYRRLDQVREAWPKLRENYPELLGDLEPHVAKLELDDLGGLYYRLKAGPFADREAASRRCERFKQLGEYCVVSAFDGRGLDESP